MTLKDKIKQATEEAAQNAENNLLKQERVELEKILNNTLNAVFSSGIDVIASLESDIYELVAKYNPEGTVKYTEDAVPVKLQKRGRKKDPSKIDYKTFKSAANKLIKEEGFINAPMIVSALDLKEHSKSVGPSIGQYLRKYAKEKGICTKKQKGFIDYFKPKSPNAEIRGLVESILLKEYGGLPNEVNQECLLNIHLNGSEDCVRGKVTKMQLSKIGRAHV